MKAYIDLNVNGNWVTTEVVCDYDIDPTPVITSVKLGGAEIIHALDIDDITHLNWCAEQNWMGTGITWRRNV